MINLSLKKMFLKLLSLIEVSCSFNKWIEIYEMLTLKLL